MGFIYFNENICWASAGNRTAVCAYYYYYYPYYLLLQPLLLLRPVGGLLFSYVTILSRLWGDILGDTGEGGSGGYHGRASGEEDSGRTSRGDLWGGGGRLWLHFCECFRARSVVSLSKDLHRDCRSHGSLLRGSSFA